MKRLRCRSHVIARHQSQFRIFNSMQQLNIIRVDDFRAFHSVSKGPVRSRQGDHVVGRISRTRGEKVKWLLRP